MLFQKLAFVSLLAGLVASQDIGDDDIPQQCRAVCAEVVAISRRCDDQTDNDRAELECICRAPNANTLVPTCEACVAQFDNDTDDEDGINDNDVREVLTRCNFTTTAYNSQSASNVVQSAASSRAAASGSIVRTTSGTVVLTTSIPAATSGPVQASTGAAPVQTAAAGAAFGLVGLAMGLL